MLNCMLGEKRLVAVMILTCVVFLGMSSLAPVSAQDCNTELQQAEEKYRKGYFDDAINLLDGCLNRSGTSKQQRMQAYRLKGLAYLAKDYLTQAKESIQNLMELVPDYEPSLEQDPPAFQQLVSEVRQEQSHIDTKPTEEPDKSGQTQEVYWPEENRTGPLFSANGGLGISKFSSPDGFDEFFGTGFNLFLNGDLGLPISTSSMFSFGAGMEIHGWGGEGFNVFSYEFYGFGRLTLQAPDGALGFYLLGGAGIGVQEFTDDEFSESVSDAGFMIPLRAGIKIKVASVVSLFFESGVSILFVKNDDLFIDENTVYFPIRGGIFVGSILD